MLLADLHLLEPAQRPQAHVQDSLCLRIGQRKPLHQPRLRMLLFADDRDHLVKIEIDEQIAVQHLQPALDRGEPVAGTADQDIVAVIQPGAQDLLQAHDTRSPGRVQHVHVERDAAFQRGGAEQRLHQHFRLRATRAWFQDQADVFGAFVAHIAQQRQLPLLDELGDLLDQPGLLHLVGDLGDHHGPGAEFAAFHRPAGAHAKTAPAAFVRSQDGGRIFHHDAAGREIGAGHMRQQFGGGRIRMDDQVHGGGANLRGVVRRNGCRHTHGDARGAVRQQIGKAARQHDGFMLLPIVRGTQIDRVLIDAGEQSLRNGGQARFGVAHGGGIIAVDIAEIPLAFDQRIPRRELLRQAHQRLVNRHIAMRVELADHVAHHTRALLEAGRRIEPEQVHRVDQAPVHRLQSVAHIGQRARHDGGERVGEIALGQRVNKARIFDMAGVVRHYPEPNSAGGDAASSITWS